MRWYLKLISEFQYRCRNKIRNISSLTAMNGSTLDSIDNVITASLNLCSQVSVLQIAAADRDVLFKEKKRLECELAAVRRASGGPTSQSVSTGTVTDGLSGF